MSRRDRRLLALLIAAAALPIGAGGWDRPVSRLRSMPVATRRALDEALDRFDRLPEPQRRAIRELDEGLARLPEPERRRYLDALERYGDWYRSLDDPTRERLDALPPSRRIGLVRELVDARGPSVDRAVASIWERSAQLNPIPLYDAAYHLRVWYRSDDRARRRVAEATGTAGAVHQLARLGSDVDPSPEVREVFLPKVEQFLRLLPRDPNRPARFFPEGRWPELSAARLLEPPRPDRRRPNAPMNLPERIRAAAIRIAEARVAEDLAARDVPEIDLETFAARLPRWYRRTLDPLPPDVARRRLRALLGLVALDPLLNDRLLTPPDPSPGPPTAPSRPAGPTEGGRRGF